MLNINTKLPARWATEKPIKMQAGLQTNERWGLDVILGVKAFEEKGG